MLLALAVFLVAFSGVSAYAVPSLGVATEFAYIGETGQMNLEDYQNYFVNTLILGTDETHGFLIGSSGEDLIVFTSYIDADIYLLTTNDVESENNPELDAGNGSLGLSTVITQTLGNNEHFDGYKPLPYWGVNLGPVDGSWYVLTGFPGSQTFYALNVTLTYDGTIGPSKYFFAAADLYPLYGSDGLDPQAGENEGFHDPFSPMTDSAVGSVPEPATMLLVGFGLIGLVGLGRKKLFKRG